jgi:hypothetical protein
MASTNPDPNSQIKIVSWNVMKSTSSNFGGLTEHGDKDDNAQNRYKQIQNILKTKTASDKDDCNISFFCFQEFEIGEVKYEQKKKGNFNIESNLCITNQDHFYDKYKKQYNSPIILKDKYKTYNAIFYDTDVFEIDKNYTENCKQYLNNRYNYLIKDPEEKQSRDIYGKIQVVMFKNKNKNENDKKLMLVNIHAPGKPIGGQRLNYFKYLSTYLDEFNDVPIYVVGDFNSDLLGTKLITKDGLANGEPDSWDTATWDFVEIELNKDDTTGYSKYSKHVFFKNNIIYKKETRNYESKNIGAFFKEKIEGQEKENYDIKEHLGSKTFKIHTDADPGSGSGADIKTSYHLRTVSDFEKLYYSDGSDHKISYNKYYPNPKNTNFNGYKTNYETLDYIMTKNLNISDTTVTVTVTRDPDTEGLNDKIVPYEPDLKSIKAGNVIPVKPTYDYSTDKVNNFPSDHTMNIYVINKVTGGDDLMKKPTTPTSYFGDKENDIQEAIQKMEPILDRLNNNPNDIQQIVIQSEPKEINGVVQMYNAEKGKSIEQYILIEKTNEADIKSDNLYKALSSSGTGATGRGRGATARGTRGRGR